MMEHSEDSLLTALLQDGAVALGEHQRTKSQSQELVPMLPENGKFQDQSQIIALIPQMRTHESQNPPFLLALLLDWTTKTPSGAQLDQRKFEAVKK